MGVSERTSFRFVEDCILISEQAGCVSRSKAGKPVGGLISINSPPGLNPTYNIQFSSKRETTMVEKSHTAGWIPNIYEPLRNISQRVADWFAPASDASTIEDCYDINVELPGVKPEDVEVSIDDNSLTVRGEKRSEREEKGRSYFFSERQYGSFQRTFRLPPDSDNEKVEADYKDGVLNLRIGKKKPLQPQAKKITITRK